MTWSLRQDAALQSRSPSSARLLGLALLLAAGSALGASHERSAAADTKDYVPEPMPPGFQVTMSEIEGPVFADRKGKTLYTWPMHVERNGSVGDRTNAPSSCTYDIVTVDSGFKDPYPGGSTLPELATRRSCAQLWPPVLAADDAKPVGNWSIIRRHDGGRQWAYRGNPVYTSTLDHRPGDALGGTNRREDTDGPGVRVPIGPSPNVPPTFKVAEVGSGRLLVDYMGFSVYSWDRDGIGKSNCVGACLNKWAPMLAAEESQPHGDWTLIQRSPGVRQWAFRGKALYTYIPDKRVHSLAGSDEPGWHNVYNLPAPARPRDFTQQEANVGIVLADSHGKTIYLYHCGDDALDQQACDHPAAPQEYRIAVCGGGDAARCLRTWQPVIASRNAKSPSRSWTTIDIDPLSGHFATAGQPGAMHVWAYRGRPVYTFSGDHAAGDTNGDAWGEDWGMRNGFRAFWLRDDFQSEAE